jgi:hypothetical protein
VLEQLVSGDLKIPHTNLVVKRFELLQKREEALEALSGHVLADAVFPAGKKWAEPLRSIVKQKFPQNKGFTRGKCSRRRGLA